MFSANSDFNKYILMGAFDEISLGGEVENIQDEFLINIDSNINMITFLKKDNKLIISLKYNDKIDRDSGTGKKLNIIKTKHTFVIHYDKPGFPVYNSEY